MARSIKRQIKKMNERKALQLNMHLEKLGAAFVKETGLKASETALRTDRATDDDGRPAGLKYWYEKHEPKVNDQTAHPDVLYLMDLCGAISRAHKAKAADIVQEGLDMLVNFFKKYELDNYGVDLTEEIVEEKAEANETSSGQ